MERRLSMRGFLRKRFPDLVGLMVLLGFFLLLAELLLTGHTEEAQALAPLFSLVGAGLLLAGLFLPKARQVLALALVLVSASGVVGLWQHLEDGLEAGESPSIRLVDRDGEEVWGWEREEGENPPPPLAPLSLSGLALLGALALYVGEEDAHPGSGG